MTLENEIIPFSKIESICSDKSLFESDELLINKLKGDFIFRITTGSGYRYFCSVNDIFAKRGIDTSHLINSGSTLESLYDEIFRDWMYGLR